MSIAAGQNHGQNTSAITCSTDQAAAINATTIATKQYQLATQVLVPAACLLPGTFYQTDNAMRTACLTAYTCVWCCMTYTPPPLGPTLPQTLELFEGEMAANNMNVAAEYNPFEYGMTAAKGGRSGKGYDVFDSLEPLAAPSLRKISAPSVAATAAATAVGGVHKTKRVRDDGGGRGGSAAATAAVLAQGDDYGMGGKCCRQLHAVVPACLVIAQYGGYDVAL